MKTVILLRHAKSSWSDPELEDHERPLNKRGKAAAPLMGDWLERSGYRPDLVLCSPAKRTRQTLRRIAAAMPDMPAAVIEPRLYHADPGEMFGILAEQPDSATSVLVVGHQPGLSAFARKLVNGHVRPHCTRAFQHFPTAAAAVLTLNVARWRELTPHTAEFIDFAVPRELTGACDRRAPPASA
ncbi:MAG: histidine phosphatase family protein [Pseudomonadota bacterium]